MRAHTSVLRQPSSPGSKSPAGQDDSATATRPGYWRRLVTRVRSWFEIPYGYQDEKGFHYGKQPTPPVFTDRASDAMTYPMALPKLTSEVPDQSPAPPAPAPTPIAKD